MSNKDLLEKIQALQIRSTQAQEEVQRIAADILRMEGAIIALKELLSKEPQDAPKE